MSKDFSFNISSIGTSSLMGVEVKLIDQHGNNIPLWLSTPEKPIFNKNTQQNTIGIIAKDPLKYNTTYLVSIKAKVNGKTWKLEWNFKTVNR